MASRSGEGYTGRALLVREAVFNQHYWGLRKAVGDIEEKACFSTLPTQFLIVGHNDGHVSSSQPANMHLSGNVPQTTLEK